MLPTSNSYNSLLCGQAPLAMSNPLAFPTSAPFLPSGNPSTSSPVESKAVAPRPIALRPTTRNAATGAILPGTLNSLPTASVTSVAVAAFPTPTPISATMLSNRTKENKAEPIGVSDNSKKTNKNEFVNDSLKARYNAMLKEYSGLKNALRSTWLVSAICKLDASLLLEFGEHYRLYKNEKLDQFLVKFQETCSRSLWQKVGTELCMFDSKERLIRATKRGMADAHFSHAIQPSHKRSREQTPITSVTSTLSADNAAAMVMVHLKRART